MLISWHLAALASVWVAFAFAIGVCVGAHPGARRINDAPASERLLRRGTNAGLALLVAGWLLFFFG